MAKVVSSDRWLSISSVNLRHQVELDGVGDDNYMTYHDNLTHQTPASSLP